MTDPCALFGSNFTSNIFVTPCVRRCCTTTACGTLEFWKLDLSFETVSALRRPRKSEIAVAASLGGVSGVLPYALHVVTRVATHVCDALVSLLVYLTLDPPCHDHPDLPRELCSLSQRAQDAKSFSSPSTMVTKYGRDSLRKTSVQQPPTLPLLEEFQETESPCTWCVPPRPPPLPSCSPPPCQMLCMPRGLQKRLIVALPSHDFLFSVLLA